MAPSDPTPAALAALEQLAKAASEGPYCLDARFPGMVYCDDVLGSAIANCNMSHAALLTREQMQRNAEYFAACSPDVILALLAAARRNEAEMQRMREYIDQCDHTILSLNGTIARERTAARRGTGDTAMLAQLAEHAEKHPSSTTAAIVIRDKLREWLATRAAHPDSTEKKEPQHGAPSGQ